LHYKTELQYSSDLCSFLQLAIAFVAMNASVEVIFYLSANNTERVCTARCSLVDEYWATLRGECNVTYVSAYRESHCRVCRLRIECSMTIHYELLVKYVSVMKYVVSDNTDTWGSEN